jgi:hypothetical protein
MTGRADHRATLLADGRVLVTGGHDDSGRAIADAEIFSPSSGTWSPAGRARIARLDHTAAALPDGRVLVVGGVTSASSCAMETTAEIFDPSARAWLSAPDPPMSVGPGATTVLTAAGQVLVSSTAGRCTDTSLRTMLFDPSSNTWSRSEGHHTAPVDTRTELERLIDGLLTTRTGHTITCLNDGSLLIVGGVVAGGVTTGADIYVPDIACNASRP